MPEKGISPRSGGTGENPIHIREHLGQKNEDELFEAVWNELEHSEDGADVDVDKILTYMDIMDDINPLPDLDLSSSWKEFEEKYGPVTDGPEAAKQQLPASDSPVPNKHRHRRVKPIRALLVVLFVSVLLMVASACGVIDYIINAVARWTDETFSFSVTSAVEESNILPETTNIEMFNSLEEAVDKFEFGTQYLPTWYPNGFKFFKAKIADSSETVGLIIDYIRGNERIGVTIFQYKNFKALEYGTVEKDNSIVEVYVYHDVEHFIMTNNAKTNVTWIIGSNMYILSGDFSVSEAKQMIISVYKGCDFL